MRHGKAICELLLRRANGSHRDAKLAQLANYKYLYLRMESERLRTVDFHEASSPTGCLIPRLQP